MSPQPNPDSALRDRCADIQLTLNVDDPTWERLFGNKQGLYGLILAERQAAERAVIERLPLHCSICGLKTTYLAADLRNFKNGMCASCGADALVIDYRSLQALTTPTAEQPCNCDCHMMVGQAKPPEHCIACRQPEDGKEAAS